MATTFDFLLDQSTNDIVIKDGDWVFTETTKQDLTQRLGIVLRGHYGEWFLDTTVYTPWKQQIIGCRDRKTIDSILLAVVNNELSSTDIIDQWNSSFDRDTRSYSLKAVITTQDETVSISYNLTPDKFYYSTQDPSNPRATCDNIAQVGADPFYEYINIEGLPNSSTWTGTWF